GHVGVDGGPRHRRRLGGAALGHRAVHRGRERGVRDRPLPDSLGDGHPPVLAPRVSGLPLLGGAAHRSPGTGSRTWLDHRPDARGAAKASPAPAAGLDRELLRRRTHVRADCPTLGGLITEKCESSGTFTRFNFLPNLYTDLRCTRGCSLGRTFPYR